MKTLGKNNSIAHRLVVIVISIGAGLGFAAISSASGCKESNAGDTKLAKILEQAGKPTVQFDSPDGSKVLLLPYGGRILGLFTKNSNENFYWTNTALENLDTAKAFLNSDKWQNTGGDRTWLAPEVDFFFPKFPDMSTYFQPRQLDPGNYKVVKNKNGLQLVNEFSVVPSRTGKELKLRITKGIEPAANPLRHEKGLDKILDNVEYAGYTMKMSLEMLGGTEKDGWVGLWDLVQMPHGGEMLIPTYRRTEPRLIMGTIGPEELMVDDHLVRYKMCADGEHKLSIRAVAVAGRIGYVYPTGEKWALIIRNFFSNPSGQYVDVPWDDTEYFGFSVQACNVKSGLGSFSELEYHIPAIGKNTGLKRCDDTAQVWAFRGPKSDIAKITKLLLGVDIND